jgi:sRNA-binding protein
MNQTKQALRHQSVGGMFQGVLGALRELVERMQRGELTDDELDTLQEQLESLPLSADDFSAACQRLRSAQRYLRARERGAARWELNALLGDLGGRLPTRHTPMTRHRLE